MKRSEIQNNNVAIPNFENSDSTLTKEKKSCPAKGKRYSKGEKQQILKQAESNGVTDSAKKFGVTEGTIYEW